MGVGRRISGPLRDYFNQHFEMVKEEVRRSGAAPPVPAGDAPASDTAAWERVSDLENALAELSVHQIRVIARLTDEVGALGDRVADLERIVAQLADVVGAAFTREA